MYIYIARESAFNSISFPEKKEKGLNGAIRRRDLSSCVMPLMALAERSSSRHPSRIARKKNETVPWEIPGKLSL